MPKFINPNLTFHQHIKSQYLLIIISRDFHLCAIGGEHGHGDSGGALQLKENGRYTAVGVVSASNTWCGHDCPDVYAR